MRFHVILHEGVVAEALRPELAAGSAACCAGLFAGARGRGIGVDFTVLPAGGSPPRAGPPPARSSPPPCGRHPAEQRRRLLAEITAHSCGAPAARRTRSSSPRPTHAADPGGCHALYRSSVSREARRRETRRIAAASSASTPRRRRRRPDSARAPRDAASGRGPSVSARSAPAAHIAEGQMAAPMAEAVAKSLGIEPGTVPRRAPRELPRLGDEGRADRSRARQRGRVARAHGRPRLAHRAAQRLGPEEDAVRRGAARSCQRRGEPLALVDLVIEAFGPSRRLGETAALA